MKMFKEDKDAWLDALRSGEYEQGQHSLHRPEYDNYCCLGVLQACLMDGKVEGEVFAVTEKFNGVPSEDFYNLFGITGHCNTLPADHRMTYEGELMGMNDGGSHTFDEIADWIEKNVKTHRKNRSAESQAKLDAVLESL